MAMRPNTHDTPKPSPASEHEGFFPLSSAQLAQLS